MRHSFSKGIVFLAAERGQVLWNGWIPAWSVGVGSEPGKRVIPIIPFRSKGWAKDAL